MTAIRGFKCVRGLGIFWIMGFFAMAQMSWANGEKCAEAWDPVEETFLSKSFIEHYPQFQPIFGFLDRGEVAMSHVKSFKFSIPFIVDQVAGHVVLEFAPEYVQAALVVGEQPEFEVFDVPSVGLQLRLENRFQAKLDQWAKNHEMHRPLLAFTYTHDTSSSIPITYFEGGHGALPFIQELYSFLGTEGGLR